MMKRLLHLLLGPGLMIASRIGGAFAAMIFTALMTRSMGAAAAGQVATGMALSMVLALVCTLNIESGAVRFIPQAMAAGNAGAVAGYVRFARRFVAGVSAIAIPAALWGIWIWFGGINTVLVIAVLAAPVLAWLRLGAGMALGLSRPVLSVLPRSLLRPVFMALLICLWLWLIAPLTPIIAMILFLLSASLTLLAQHWLLRAPLRNVLTADPAFADARDWVRTGLALGLNVLFLEFGIYLTVLAAATVLPPQDTARLDVALKIVALAVFAIQAIGRYYGPTLSAALVVNDRAKLTRVLATTALLRAAVGIPTLAVILISGGTILSIFGPAFAQDTWLLAVLSVEAMLIVAFGQGTMIVGFSKRPLLLLPLLGATLTALIAGCVIAGQFWGLAGVASAVVMARLVWVAGGAWLAYRMTGLNVTILAVLSYRQQGSGNA